RKLGWLRQITVPARAGAPESVDAPLVFDGQGLAGDLTGKILVRLNTGAGRRGGAASTPTGALGTLTIDAVTGVEPPRWPVAYSVAVTLADAAPAQASAAVAFRLNPASADLLFEGSGHTYSE